MSIYVIADLHLSFSQDKPMDIFGKNWENHAEKIKQDWLAKVNDDDMVVLPGGMPGSVNLRDDERVINLLKEFNSNNKKIAAICAGPISLGKAGLSEGKNVTCYPGFEDQLGNCNYQKELVVVDGNIITGRGPAAAIPFAFEILKQIAPEKVEEIKKAMLFN